MNEGINESGQSGNEERIEPAIEMKAEELSGEYEDFLAEKKHVEAALAAIDYIATKYPHLVSMNAPLGDFESFLKGKKEDAEALEHPVESDLTPQEEYELWLAQKKEEERSKTS